MAYASDKDYIGSFRVDTAMFLIADPCRLRIPPEELAQLVRDGHAALVAVDSDGDYYAAISHEADGLVVDVDPDGAAVIRPGEAFGLLEPLGPPDQR